MSANVAVALADGMLSVREREQWEPHLARCGICRQMVAALVQSTDASLPHVAADARLDPLVSGRRFGRYRLLQRLGAGGFGIVYRAHDPELGRDVALKLWRFHGDEPSAAEDARKHLLREARALAQLSHPNVMAVFEAGREGDEVFIAAELIEGRSCAELIAEGLDRRRAVDIAVQAARALAAAHAAGLVHRDVKPDNLLLGNDGRVRVVDFGLASARRPSTYRELQASRLPHGSTMTGGIVGTPAYMAPEQFRGSIADPASDQFSLCVSLFEMLAGKRPFTGRDFDDLRQAVLENRRESLPSDVPRWLVRVVERGLAHDPRARFPSMVALVDALLHDSGTVWRRLAWSGCSVLGGAAALWGWPEIPGAVDCDAASSKFGGIWDTSRRETVRSRFAEVARGEHRHEAFTRVAAKLDDYTRDWIAMRRDVCEATHLRGAQSTELHDRQVLCLARRHRELADLVALFESADAALVDRAPRAVHQLAPLEQCADVDALALLSPLPGDPSAQRALSELHDDLAEVEALRMAGKYPEATTRAQAAAERAVSVGYLPTIAEAKFALGNMWSYQKRSVEATPWLEGAYYDAVAARAWRVAARAAIQLVFVHGELANAPERGTAWARYAHAALLSGGGDRHLQADLESNLGALAVENGDASAAIAHHERALAMREQTEGPQSVGVAQALNNLGLALEDRGDYAAASERFARAHEIFAAAFGRHHPYVGQTAQNLGNIHLILGDPATAQTLFQQAHVIFVDAHGPSSVAAIDAQFSLATALDEQGRSEEAMALLESNLESRRQLFPGDRDAIARVLNSLAAVADKRGKLADARRYLEEALEIRRDVLGRDHPETLFIALNLAMISTREARGQRALELLSEVVTGFEDRLGAEHPYVALGRIARAQQRLNDGEPRAALLDLERGLESLRAQDVDPEWIADAVYHRGRALWQLGKHEQGRAEVQSALAMYTALGERGANSVAEAGRWLRSR